jgi:hypothetical protein
MDKGFGLRKQLVTCVNGHSHYNDTLKNGVACPLCGQQASSNTQSLLFPRHGFTTAAWDPPKYGSESETIGHTICQTLTFHEQRASSNDDNVPPIPDFAGIQHLNAEWRQNAEILVTNPGKDNKGFAICTTCGFAESEENYGKGRMGLPPGFGKHASLFSTKRASVCWGEPDDGAPVLRNQVLAASQHTDILLLDWSHWLKFSAQNHKEIHVALASALRLAGARLLELDLREIGAMTNIPTGSEGTGLGIALYDDTPGGCGHVRELMKIERTWIEEARHLLYSNANHDKSCEHGCLDCILSFGPNDSSDDIRPDRRKACEMLAALMKGSTWAPPAPHSGSLGSESSNTEFAPDNPDNCTASARILKRRLVQASHSGNRNASPWEKDRIRQKQTSSVNKNSKNIN